ncbi:unnamed protein product [Vitrella brassicaformis CCMP3155]|uniref:Uncharacterized protein n=1 Tax=Vitrella brassicaformis (strain CCMP3155) TaxID=1169540 RepID=A0A0G4F5E4_VITBC|nr:unnamed protein product [Vitrella brassicaformis CCMP3155]|eukprot:CEM06953.1 unnamed protein product [Vitrella brassicaformis CCMP3155]
MTAAQKLNIAAQQLDTAAEKLAASALEAIEKVEGQMATIAKATAGTQQGTTTAECRDYGSDCSNQDVGPTEGKQCGHPLPSGATCWCRGGQCRWGLE